MARRWRWPLYTPEARPVPVLTGHLSVTWLATFAVAAGDTVELNVAIVGDALAREAEVGPGHPGWNR